MKWTLLLLAAVLSLGDASVVVSDKKEKDVAAFVEEKTWTLASPKEMLRQALVEHIQREIVVPSQQQQQQQPQQQRNLRRGLPRLLEDAGQDNNNDDDGKNDDDDDDAAAQQQEQEEQNNDDGNNNNNDDDGQEQEEEDEDIASQCALCDRFNNMSHSSKIWTLVLICWGFILMLAICILMVRACTARDRYYGAKRKQQPLIASSLGLDKGNNHNNNSGDYSGSRGRSKTRRGWFGRRRSRTPTRSRSRSRNRM
jgi:hypothetical protein